MPRTEEQRRRNCEAQMRYAAKLGPETVAKRQAVSLAIYKRRMSEARAVLGGVCCRCGFSDERALQIDHIEGGGNEERRRIGQHQVIKRVLAGEPGYQLLCANCNWIKLHERRERQLN